MHKTSLVLPFLALALAFPAVVSAAEDDSFANGDGEPPRAAPVDVEPVRGIRYRVWLKSGRSMEGVVRAKGVFEVHQSESGYRPADDDESGAGIRIWFPAAQDGFIFMPVDSIRRLEELGELSPDEGRSIARARVDAAHRAERERFQIKQRRAAEERAAEEAAAAEAGEAEAGEAEAGDAGAEAVDEESGADEASAAEAAAAEAAAGEMAALLLRFPPDRWSLDSPAEIERRKVILGLFPSGEEKEFLRVFDDWKVAFEAWAEANDAETGDARKVSGAKVKPAPKKARSGREEARVDGGR